MNEKYKITDSANPGFSEETRLNSTLVFSHPSTGSLKLPVKKRKSWFKSRSVAGKPCPSDWRSCNTSVTTAFSSSAQTVHPDHWTLYKSASTSTSELPSNKCFSLLQSWFNLLQAVAQLPLLEV